MSPNRPASSQESTDAAPVGGPAALPGFGGSRLGSLVRRLLRRYRPSEPVILVVTSLAVGLGTGLVAIAFRLLVGLVDLVGHEMVPALVGQLTVSGEGLLRPALLVLAPALGGLAAGGLVHRYAREAEGSGVPEVMAAVALEGGRIRPIVMLVKPLASALTIGSGGSAGREGPIVQTGSALGSIIGQRLGLSENRVRHLVACGAAGGIAATFNTPIAGVFFALEVILGRFGVSNFGPVVLAAVVASVVGRIFYGDVFAFAVPEYSIRSLWEFALYAVLGLLAAIVAVIFSRTLYGTADAFRSICRTRPWVRPAIGGALVGALAATYGRLPALAYSERPQVFGVGYEVIESALHNEQLLAAMLMLLVLKLVATSLTLGSGGSGGIFAPSLVIGAMLGGAFGQVANLLFPGVAAPPGAYALVGMGAVFAGSTLAPITAVLTLFEMTGDYRIILPLMMTVAIATSLARHWLAGQSTYTLKLSRKGIHLAHGRSDDVMQSVLVEEVMAPEVATVHRTMTLGEVSAEFSRTQRPVFVVVDEAGRVAGIVALPDTRRALEQGLDTETPVSEFATSDVVVTYPDETIAEALRTMGVRGVEQVPVVSRQDRDVLRGMVGHRDLIRAYNIALARRAEVHSQAKRMQLRNVSGADFMELELAGDAPAVGHKVKELAPLFPEEFVLVSVRRANGKVVIPHGDTAFVAGDQVTAFGSPAAESSVRELLVGGSGQ